jgi:pantetheine-phosphate adenylyltransferase
MSARRESKEEARSGPRKAAGRGPSGPAAAVFPGSFDPVTRGHLDLIRRAAELFPRLVVAVVANPGKSPWFSAAERVALLAAELEALVRAGRVEVESFTGLAVQLARGSGARWIVRGLRSADDAHFELPMALSNRLAGEVEIETVFLAASAGTAFISSRLVREIALHGGKLVDFVTPGVEKALRDKARSLLSRSPERGPPD